MDQREEGQAGLAPGRAWGGESGGGARPILEHAIASSSSLPGQRASARESK